jgi:hypothetical protein
MDLPDIPGYHVWQNGPLFYATYQGPGAREIEPSLFFIVGFSVADLQQQVGERWRRRAELPASAGSER